jgi:cytochrome P450
VVFAEIEGRRAGARRDDLLSMLLDARDPETGEAMSDRQLRDEVVTMFTAGHETTANLLSWTFYLLSTHPEIERRVRDELERVVGGRPATFADLPGLGYLRQVVQETMRLYPPVWTIGRGVVADDAIGGYRIPRGADVTLSAWVTHRHPGLWENPEGFDPDRFADPARLPRYAYFPFSGGARQCIGNSFAMMEAQLILATVLARFRPELVEGHRVEPEPLVTLRPRHGLPMHLRPATRA